MRIQKAINELVDYVAENDKLTISFETVTMAIAALEKQIPKKMNDIDEYEEDELCGYCPQCNKLQSNLWNENFCGDCGQAIDWGEGKMSMISEFVEKLRGRLKKELQLADEDKRKADVLQFDRAVGYANGMAIAIDILNQLAEEYKGVPDTDVGKNFSENLIEKIKFAIEASNINDNYTIGLRNGMRYCLSLIDGKEPKFESCKEDWIPCEEALPGKYCHCLVTRRNEYENGYDTDVREDVYLEIEGVWDWQSKFEGLHDEIIAWQPLPEPYKGEYF